MDNLEEIKDTLDQVLINTALNTAQLQTLTQAFWELSYHLSSEEETKNLRSNYFDTLYEKSAHLLNQPDFLYHPESALKALFQLKSFVDSELKD